MLSNIKDRFHENVRRKMCIRMLDRRSGSLYWVLSMVLAILYFLSSSFSNTVDHVAVLLVKSGLHFGLA